MTPLGSAAPAQCPARCAVTENRGESPGIDSGDAADCAFAMDLALMVLQ